MSSIIEINQKNEHAKILRFSFAKSYNKAKKINSIIIVISFFIPILSLLNKLFVWNKDDIIGVFSTIWIIISIFLKNKQDNIRKIAADIQEEFDTYVFNISKNKIITLPEISIEDKYLGKSSEEELYYSKLYSEDKIINILICQRENIVYDRNMRNVYKWINLFFLTVYIILIGIIGIVNEFILDTFLISIIVPSINIIVYFIEKAINLSGELELLNQADSLIKKSLSDKDFFIDADLVCRQYQDFIYSKRRNWTIIPNYIYKMNKLLSKKDDEEIREYIKKELSEGKSL